MVKKTKDCELSTKQVQELLDSIYNASGWLEEPVKSKKYMKPTKTKKTSVASGFDEINIAVMANGYIVTVGNGTAENTYVFPTMKALNDWIKDNMHPTFRAAEFMEQL